MSKAFEKRLATIFGDVGFDLATKTFRSTAGDLPFHPGDLRAKDGELEAMAADGTWGRVTLEGGEAGAYEEVAKYVVLGDSPGCRYTVLAKNLLDSMRVEYDFTQASLSMRAGALQAFRASYPGVPRLESHNTFPVVLVQKGDGEITYVGGYTDLARLHGV